MKYYPFSLTASGLGSTDFLDVNATFVRFDEETTGIPNNRIRFKTNNGKDFDLRPGEAVQISPACERLQIANRDGVGTITGTLAIAGPGELVIPSLILSGGVSVLQTVAGAPRNLDADSSANAFAMNNTGSGGGLEFLGIANPAGSGKRIYVDAVSVWSSAADVVFLNDGTDAAGASGGAWRSIAQLGAGPVAGAGLKRSGNGAIAGSTITMGELSCEVANKEVRRVFTRAYPLDPGRGLYVQSNTIALTLTSSWEGREY